MNPGTPTRVIASCMGLSAFAVATIAGLAADNPADSILVRAVVSMFVCHGVGLVIGVIGERSVSEGVTKYRAANIVSEETATVKTSG